tara:strand:+ start:1919 stop:2269 length:351 start_codon:yes stop_codon:yes gene_type:complete
MISAEHKKNLILTILGWMTDIADRVGEGLAWPMTSIHRDAVEFIREMDLDTVYSSYHEMATNLMSCHAIARNDIYDSAMCWTKLSEHGGASDEAHLVTREERDIRRILDMWPLCFD